MGALRGKLSAEIANGRLAMMAIIGMFFQDGLTGSAWGDWALYTASPLRAFENELGVQDPVGFWDPAGFATDGNMENFARRRQTELKHGRVSMLATMGYITPEITGKFPGYLSPSAGLKFADIPNGLAAISKVPAAGWGQIVAYAAFCELSQDQSAGTSAASGDFGWKLLTSSDPEALGATGRSTRPLRYDDPLATSDPSASSVQMHGSPAKHGFGDALVIALFALSGSFPVLGTLQGDRTPEFGLPTARHFYCVPCGAQELARGCDLHLLLHVQNLIIVIILCCFASDSNELD